MIFGEISLLVASLVAGFLAILYGKKVKVFRWSEYIALLIVPVAGSLALSYEYGIKIIYLFFASMVVGFCFEYVLGFAYYKTLNKHLWYYSRYSLGGYTSLLTLPMWGVAGIVFWILSQYVGL